MKKLLSLIVLSIFVLSTNLLAQHEDITGLWKTIDDDIPGRVKSVVKIYINDGKLYGDVVKLFRLPDEDPDPNCDECDEDDPRKDQKVLGMTILNDMVLDEDDNEWEDLPWQEFLPETQSHYEKNATFQYGPEKTPEFDFDL